MLSYLNADAERRREETEIHQALVHYILELGREEKGKFHAHL
jgi:hypothetical protein